MTAPGKPIPSAGKKGEPESKSPRTPETQEGTAPSIEPGKPVDTTPPVPGVGVPKEELERRDRLIAAQEATLRDLYRTNKTNEERLKALEGGALKKPEGPSEEQRNKDFFTKPVTGLSEVVREIIRDELTKTVGPLNDMIRRGAHDSEYDKLKRILKEQYADIWPHIEPGIDDFVRQASDRGIEVGPDLMNIAALTASGAYYRNGVLAPAASAQTTQKESVVVDPPHLRPSAPVIPGERKPQEETRTLTENEKRLARERGYSDKQYLDWLNVPPEEVIHYRGDKEEKQ